MPIAFSERVTINQVSSLFPSLLQPSSVVSTASFLNELQQLQRPSHEPHEHAGHAGQPSWNHNQLATELMATISTSSCDEGIRTDLAVMAPDSSIVDRLLLAAWEAARACRSLSANDLRSCASKVFDVPPECELSSAFAMAYQNEPDAMAGRRQFEKRLETRA
jgi:hypothetical protein